MTILGPGQSTPSPWINVIANPTFGFQTATEGSGYTWSANSHENQLPLGPTTHQRRARRSFLRARRQTGHVWSPTAVSHPRRLGIYVARHGRGYSRFEHTSRRDLHRSSSICARRRISQNLAPSLIEHIEPDPPPERDRLRRVGARLSEIRNARFCRNRDRRSNRGALARNPSNVPSAPMSLLPTCGASSAIGRAIVASS